MRGERPGVRILHLCKILATPHARGSTVYSDDAADLSTGYPACAGIDLLPHTMSFKRVRLPRMRGDRP